jgi:hypothetical protein
VDRENVPSADWQNARWFWECSAGIGNSTGTMSATFCGFYWLATGSGLD